jgi:hypothetical protein
MSDHPITDMAFSIISLRQQIATLTAERDALFVLTDRLTAERDALRAERDEARREVLLWVKDRCSWVELTAEIKTRGWEYLKETYK